MAVKSVDLPKPGDIIGPGLSLFPCFGCCMNTARFMLAGLAAMMVLVGDCAESEARCRLFRRCVARRNCPRYVCPPVRAAAPMDTRRTYTHLCPLYAAYQINGEPDPLYMYYAVPSYYDTTQSPPRWVCDGSPQALHDNLTIGCGTQCVPTLAHYGPKKVKSKGCEKGYKGDTPVVGTPVGDFTYVYDKKRVAVRLSSYSTVLPNGSTWTVGVGYEIWPTPAAADFPPDGAGSPVGDLPKCFDVIENSISYHVQLHK